MSNTGIQTLSQKKAKYIIDKQKGNRQKNEFQNLWEIFQVTLGGDGKKLSIYLENTFFGILSIDVAVGLILTSLVSYQHKVY